VAYTDRQIQLIRDRLVAYYDVESRGPVRATWGGLCDEIFEIAGVQMDDEVLRQFAKRATRKDRPEQPRLPSAENLEALVKFLCHTDIDMLSLEELEASKPPYRFLHSFLEFLSDSRSGPPRALYGGYEAWHREETGETEEKWIKASITFEGDFDQRIVHATEDIEIHFRKDGEVDVIGGDRPSEGWGVVTPDGNLFLFMRTQPFAGNYYYLTMAVNPHLFSDSKDHQLVLLRHERPAMGDLSINSLEALIKETNGRTVVLIFKKVAALKGSGE
jgi:hypothetical protein